MSLLALRLSRPAKGENLCVVDLFPDLYQTILDVLLTSACAYVSFMVSCYNKLLTSSIDCMCDVLPFCWISGEIFRRPLDCR